jgi:hypothetical protein
MKNSIRIIMILCVLATHLALNGCGGGVSGETDNAVVTETSDSAMVMETSDSAMVTESSDSAVAKSSSVSAGNSYSLTEDTYGLQNATFMSASNSNGLFVLRAAIASKMTDPNFTTVFRIDILKPKLISGPGSYAVGGLKPKVGILFFNGHRSTLLNTTKGTIKFTSYSAKSGKVVAGSFAVVVQDQNSISRPTYSVKGKFRFVVNTSGVLMPTPSPVPAAASGEYNTNCAYCHALGSVDRSSAGGAPDLALKGGEIAGKFAAGHNNITLSTSEISGLKVLLNAN